MITNRLAKADPRLSDLIPEGKSADGFAGAAFSKSPPSATGIDVLVVLNRDQLPERFKNAPKWRVASGMYTVRIRENQFDDLLACPEVESVYGPQLMRMTLDTSREKLRIPALAKPDGHLSRTGKGVVVGIIDYGFDLTHPDFRNEDGTTRVAVFWDQSQSGRENPDTFNYGVEYDQKAINDALKEGRERTFDILQHRPEEGAHGTLVAGIAAGNGRASEQKYVGAAPDATLILVNLALDPARNLVPQQNVYQAVEYIFNKAENAFDEPPDFNQPKSLLRRVRKPRKQKKACVVNLSFSRNDGGHDGYSPIEQVIDRLLRDTAGRAVVVAAGNAGNDRLHAEWEYSANATTELEWVVPPADQQQSGSYELELWYSSRDHISVQLLSPEGEESDIIAPGMTSGDKLFSGTSTLIESMRFLKPGCDARIFLRLRQPAMAGKWLVRLKTSADSHAGSLHGWIDDTPDEQSRASFGNAVAPRCTLGSPATARYCISVGNIDHRSTPMVVVDSSGRGPTRDGREKPEIVAPGQEIMSSSALGGLNEVAAQPRPLHGTGSGTSMSAPHITGIIACLFQEHGGLTPRQIQKVLMAAGTGDHYDEREGYGIIDAERALELVRNFVRSQ
jgi:subtilisin family serine protease